MSQPMLAEEFETLSAEAAIDRLLAENIGAANKGSLCLTCSFQAEDMIVLDLLRRRLPDIPVLFLDTGYHFAETYAYRDRMAQAWNLNVRNLAAKQSVADQESQFGILESHRSGTLLPLAQSRTSFQRARGIRRVVHRLAPRAIAHAQKSKSAGAPRAALGQSAPESESSRRLDLGPNLEIHRGE